MKRWQMLCFHTWNDHQIFELPLQPPAHSATVCVLSWSRFLWLDISIGHPWQLWKLIWRWYALQSWTSLSLCKNTPKYKLTKRSQREFKKYSAYTDLIRSWWFIIMSLTFPLIHSLWPRSSHSLPSWSSWRMRFMWCLRSGPTLQ